MRRRLSDTLRAATETALRGVHTALPARIESYDHTQQRASVKPLLRRILSDGREEELGVISNVRVVWPESGGASMTFPVKPGDGCLIVCAERSLDKWLDSGGLVTPDDPRRHALQDAVAIMGFESFAAGTLAENNDDVLITYSGSQFRLKPDGNVELDSTASVTVNTQTATINADTEAVVNTPLAEVNTDDCNVTATVQTTIDSPQTTVTGAAIVNGLLTAAGGLTVTGAPAGGGAPAQISGDMEQTGGVFTSDTDVTAAGISLVSHTHPGDSGGNTGPPN